MNLVKVDQSVEIDTRGGKVNGHVSRINPVVEQLDAPIAIFNAKLQLSHANGAFSNYITQPWRSKRLCSSAQLGLILNENDQWKFAEHDESLRWQLKYSQFIQDQQKYHLVILTNVETLLRKNQLQSWQQIIRVLSYEIRNSLTPIKSLAQTLAELPSQNEQFSQALRVIVERSTALQDFVNRYGDISKRLTVNKSLIKTPPFIDSIISLFPTQNFKLSMQSEGIWADPVLLKQVLINLIKNAVEASTDIDNDLKSANKDVSLKIYFVETKTLLIEIFDQGHGIANPENIFVPFYITKAQGKGIGATAKISLPYNDQQ